MVVSNAALEYYGFKFVNESIREKYQITFEQYLVKVLGDQNGA